MPDHVRNMSKWSHSHSVSCVSRLTRSTSFQSRHNNYNLPICTYGLLIPQLCHIYGERQHSLRGCGSQNDREVSDSAAGGEKRSRRKLARLAPAKLSSASCAGRTRSCAAPGPASSSAAALPPPAPAPCSPGPGCCPPADASPLKHKQAQASEVIKFKDSPPRGPQPMKDSTSHLCVLFVVQRLGVRVVFANQRIHQQQEEHVEQQSTNDRQVDDDGDLGQRGGGVEVCLNIFCMWHFYRKLWEEAPWWCCYSAPRTCTRTAGSTLRRRDRALAWAQLHGGSCWKKQHMTLSMHVLVFVCEQGCMKPGSFLKRPWFSKVFCQIQETCRLSILLTLHKGACTLFVPVCLKLSAETLQG